MKIKIIVNTINSNHSRLVTIFNNEVLNIESSKWSQSTVKGNIYKGKITGIKKDLSSLFISYGANRDGFLPFREISNDVLSYLNIGKSGKLIKDELHVMGKFVFVQVEKDEKGKKGALLTTYLQISGLYLVIMLNKLGLEGVSRNITNIEGLFIKSKIGFYNNFASNLGIIVRTSGLYESFSCIKWELNLLISQFKNILGTFNSKYETGLLHRENSLISKLIKDYINNKIDELVVDNILIFNIIVKYMHTVRSTFFRKVKLYKGNINIFSFYNIHGQINLFDKQEVFLKSGGMLILDSCEALFSVDINSSRSKKIKNSDETSLKSNVEAAHEIMKQLKVRNVSGIIIIDVIDHKICGYNTLVEKNFKECFISDRKRIQMSRISKIGIIQLSREMRNNKSISDYKLCSYCKGSGKILNVKNLCKILIEVIEEKSISIFTYQVHLESSDYVINYISNTYRSILSSIEHKYSIRLILLSNHYMHSNQHKTYIFSSMGAWQCPTFAYKNYHRRCMS